MESIFYATDIHLTDKQPINRVTPTQPGGLKALEKVLSVAKDAYLILGGDLFENPCPSYDLFNSVVKLIKNADCSVFSVFGNHDIPYTDINAENNALRALVNMGLITVLNSTPTKIAGFDVYGVSYKKELYTDFKQTGLEINDPTKSIVVTHQFMSDMKLPFNHIMLKDFNAENVSIVLCGHLHKPFNVLMNNTRFLNTGCVCKLNRNEGVFGTTVGKITQDGTVSVIELTEETNIEFVKKQVETHSFIKSVEDAKVESQDIYSYIQSGDEPKLVKETALALIKEFENA